MTETLKAGSQWKIYTRYGEMIFPILKDITLNPPTSIPEEGFHKIENKLRANHPWYHESYYDKDKSIGAWPAINETFKEDASLLWIVQIGEKYFLVVDGMSSMFVNEYAMFNCTE